MMSNSVGESEPCDCGLHETCAKCSPKLYSRTSPSVGFTGTRRGMTQAQLDTLKKLLTFIAPVYVHSGDCVGADEQFSGLVSDLLPDVYTVGHPPDSPKLRAFLKYNLLKAFRPALERNGNIVSEGQILIAAPYEAEEKLRSGTWATIRYARKAKRIIYIIKPDGKIVREN